MANTYTFTKFGVDVTQVNGIDVGRLISAGDKYVYHRFSRGTLRIYSVNKSPLFFGSNQIVISSGAIEVELMGYHSVWNKIFIKYINTNDDTHHIRLYADDNSYTEWTTPIGVNSDIRRIFELDGEMYIPFGNDG